MTKRIAMLFPYAPSYREAIYRKMDACMDVHWFFAGNAERNLRLLDYSVLKSCNLDMSEKKVFGPVTRYAGVNNLGLGFYDVIIIAGIIKNITEWILLLKYGRKKKGPKVLLWTHGWYGKESKFQRVIKKFYFSLADGLLLYGNYAKEGLIKLGVEEKKLFVIHNSLDYDVQLANRIQISETTIFKEHFHNDYPVLIFLGRLTRIKHLDMLLDAVSILNQQGEKANIVFVGDGEMKDSLQKQTKKLELNDRVWFYGECFDEKRNAELLYNADLCVAPGNVGLTAMHSLMFGCPVLTHNDFKWQMPEFESIKEGKTGSFFDMDNVKSMATKISAWIKGPGKEREKIRKSCYSEIDNYWTPEYQIGVIENAISSIEKQ